MNIFDIQRCSTIREWSQLLSVRTGRETREDMIRVIRTTIGRKGEHWEEEIAGKRDGRKKERRTFCCAWCISFKAYGEPRALSLVAITMRRALEFEISRIGARSIHLKDNIFRSKYEYYIISAVDAGFSLLHLPPYSSPRVPIPFLPLPRVSL